MARVPLATLVAGLGLVTAPAAAEWTAAGPAVTAAATQPEVAAVVALLDRMDRSLIEDDHAAFAALLAGDLVVNNPQNGVSEPGMTKHPNAGGRSCYVSHRRVIDDTGMRRGMVVLMGEEIVVPRAPNPMAGQTVQRRFTDL